MAIAVTEGTYSRDNTEPSLCLEPDGTGCWMAWAAFGHKGSRAFLRHFDGTAMGPVETVSPHDCLQTRPLCVPTSDGVRFVWFEKRGQSYSIWRRETAAGGLSDCVEVTQLPEAAKPWELQALCDGHGVLWLSWAQATRGESSIQALRVGANGDSEQLAVGTTSRHSYRPRMAELGDDGIYLVWDSYVDGVYDVYGCTLSAVGAGETVRISRDSEWENKATICRDREGGLWAAWVRWQDVMYHQSTIQQKFSVRGARYDGTRWEPVDGPDAGDDIASLNYGMLTDFPHPPQLGHMGRRLFPMLRGADDGGVWLLWESKVDQAQGTLTSKGRLLAQRWTSEGWAEPRCVAEGRVFYEIPHDGVLAGDIHLLARDIESDELYLEQVALSTELPSVPIEKRGVDEGQWENVRLPLAPRDPDQRPRNGLAGPEQGKYQLYWADLHAHSSVSHEMEGEPDELGHYARDKAQIDALTISDNDNFWNRHVRQQVRHLTDTEWDYAKGNALALNEEGRFALFPGYEMGSEGQTALERDHRSVMSDDDEMEMDPFNFKYYDAYMRGERSKHKDTRECMAWFKKKGYLVLPHPHHGYWRLYDTDVEWGVDVCAAWMINFDLYDIYYRYLDEGHRFAFTGSGDGHYRNPGLSGALTGIWAERLDRASLLDAIRARRCFATAGQRIVMELTVDGHMMGNAFTVRPDPDRPPPDPYMPKGGPAVAYAHPGAAEDPVLAWRVIGEDQEYILRVLRDGRVIHDERFFRETRGTLKEYMLCQYRPGRHYYHLEVHPTEPIPQYPANVAHAMGAKGWTTPIWVDTEGQT